MSPIHVIVVATFPDVMAEVIAAAVERRTDMRLAAQRIVAVPEVGDVIASIEASVQCALVVVGQRDDTEELAGQWLAGRGNLVILRLDITDNVIQFACGDIGLEPLLSALKGLVERVGGQPHDRVLHLQMRHLAAAAEAPAAQGVAEASARPLLAAAAAWIHAVLRSAVQQLAGGQGDMPGLTVTAATAAQLLDACAGSSQPGGAEVDAADSALAQALADADVRTEPLAAAARALQLTPVEWRMVLLALAPELDARYQRCLGVLLDDLGRRVGTLGLYAALLGAPTQVRCALGQSGELARWRLLDCPPGELPPADEPLRLDAPFANWLLGDDGALECDPHLRRVLRRTSWPGADLLERHQERLTAASLYARLHEAGASSWTLLAGPDAAGWRALLELGAVVAQRTPVRVALARLAGTDPFDAEEAALRLGRLAQLTDRPLLIDATGLENVVPVEHGIRAFYSVLAGTGCRAAVIGEPQVCLAALPGSALCTIEDATILAAARLAIVRAAAAGADVLLTEEDAQAIAGQYPLHIDGFERAMRLARGTLLSPGAAPRDRFISACRQLCAEGVSRLGERIAPVFSLDDVILPADRKQQLVEIGDSIRFGPQVLDGWQFRAHLPYGRGVTALFHGPSGTGKTMAAMAVARSLSVELLRLDFSRVVSKYIGETEKNIDRVFNDAQQSGCAILIDEADALLGKRSEVKDAHDRYANIEVAYLLQRMEAYEGLAILTTNLRQNLDASFLRRLRFIVDFPRPDASAREAIWRGCLPAAAHAIDAGAFRVLARKVELTGGHIRQITLRAAFVAAAAGKLIAFEHLLYAVDAELAKLGMPALELDSRRAA